MSREQMIAELKKIKPSYNYDRYEDAQIFRMYQRYVLDKNTPKGDPVTQQVEPTTPVEKSIEDYEKEYEDQVGYKTCDTCGTRLNDMGTCPKCDDGEEDLLHNSKLTTDIEADDDFNLEKTCVLCGNKIFGYGNNASPVADGTCCDLCNMEKVIPARLNQFRSKRK